MTPPADVAGGALRQRLASAAARLVRVVKGEYSGDTLWALVDQGTSLVSSTLSFLLLGRTLGAAGYGAYVGLYAVIGPFLSLSQAGVFLAVLEHVAREREDPAEVAGSCLTIGAVNALFWVPVLAAVGLRWIEGVPAVTAVLLIGAEFWLNGLLITSVGMVQAVSSFPAAARLRIAGTLARIGLLLVLAASGALTLPNLAIGQALTLGAVGLYALSRVARLLGGSVRPGRIRLRHVRSALVYGLGLAASSAQADGDKFVLNAAHHQADAGRYGVAYRLMGIVALPLGALTGATHLSFLEADPAPNAQLKRAARLSLVALAYGVPAVGGLVLLAPLLPRILARDFSETTLILQLLAPVVLLRGVGVFPMNGLMGLGRNGLRTKLLVGNALFSLVLYGLLIPEHAWRGALVATLASEVTLCGSAWVALVTCERRRSRALAQA